MTGSPPFIGAIHPLWRPASHEIAMLESVAVTWRHDALYVALTARSRRISLAHVNMGIRYDTAFNRLLCLACRDLRGNRASLS